MSRMTRGASCGALLIVVGWTSATCARRPAVAEAACVAPPDSARAVVPADSVVGDYRLTLVVTVGPSAGRRTSGTMTLRRVGEGARRVQGSASIALDSVGALAAGSIESTDAARPGVLAIDDGGSLLLRFGALANATDLVMFDGAYTTLTVTARWSDEFAGRWRSGTTGVTRQTEGYFCALRNTRPARAPVTRPS
jgi:hypothetical protein